MTERQFGPQPPRGGAGAWRGGSGANRSNQARERSLAEIWPGYLSDGYFDSGGRLKPALVLRNRLVPLIQEMDRSAPRLTMHQIRRFFQHCRAIEARIRAKISTWEDEEAAFRKLDVAAADAFGKNNPKIPKIFHDFIERNVAAVRTGNDFLKGFLPHFEALVGFGSQFLRERERS
jgi:CRISPR type III-A-associated protein Csm2